VVERSELVIRAASLVPAGRALDLACGSGRNARYLAEHGWQVIAIDIEPRVAPPFPATLEVRTLDLETTPIDFDDESFDLIVMTHYYQPSLFPVVRRLLRRGGVLVTSAKLAGRFAAPAGALRGAFEDWDVVHVLEDGKSSELIVRKT